MTDYNDGKWHGWNGGDCPVNPDSLIVCAYRSLSTSATGQYASMGTQAAIAPWADIIAFRVIQPAPAKPREFWLTIDRDGSRWFYTEEVQSDDYDVIHVREVIE